MLWRRLESTHRASWCDPDLVMSVLPLEMGPVIKMCWLPHAMCRFSMSTCCCLPGHCTTSGLSSTLPGLEAVQVEKLPEVEVFILFLAAVEASSVGYGRLRVKVQVGLPPPSLSPMPSLQGISSYAHTIGVQIYNYKHMQCIPWQSAKCKVTQNPWIRLTTAQQVRQRSSLGPS